MPDDDLLSARTSALSAHATVIQAALLAADVSGPEGFRPTDVRFFFLLFTNWMEDDRLRPALDVDLTQVRRALLRLVGEKLAVTVGSGSEQERAAQLGCSVYAGESVRKNESVRRGRSPRYRLLPAGVLALVEAMTDARTPRSFEEVVFLATAAASYRDAIAERVRGGPRAPDRIVRARLDPARILRAEQRRLEGVLADLEERVASGLRMEEVARAAAGESLASVAGRLRAEVGSHQLHPMRSLEELVAVLPEPMARFELGPGMGLRSRALFQPLLEQVRARLAILGRLEATLRETSRDER